MSSTKQQYDSSIFEKNIDYKNVVIYYTYDIINNIMLQELYEKLKDYQYTYECFYKVIKDYKLYMELPERFWDEFMEDEDCLDDENTDEFSKAHERYNTAIEKLKIAFLSNYLKNKLF